MKQTTRKLCEKGKGLANLLINSLSSFLFIHRGSQAAALGWRQDDAAKSLEIQHAGSGWERRRCHHGNSRSPLKRQLLFLLRVSDTPFLYIYSLIRLLVLSISYPFSFYSSSLSLSSILYVSSSVHGFYGDYNYTVWRSSNSLLNA